MEDKDWEFYIPHYNEENHLRIAHEFKSIVGTKLAPEFVEFIKNEQKLFSYIYDFKILEYASLQPDIEFEREFIDKKEKTLSLTFRMDRDGRVFFDLSFYKNHRETRMNNLSVNLHLPVVNFPDPNDYVNFELLRDTFLDLIGE